MELVAPQRGDKVLDFGCGVGNLTKILAERVGPEGKVIGVDPDTDRIRLAREKYSAGNLEYVIGSVESIPGGNYDVIFCNYVLHYCVDKDAVLKTFATKLKGGGHLGFSACVEDDVNKYIKSLPELYGQQFIDAYTKYFHYTSSNEFKCISTRNHFKLTHFEEFIVPRSFRGISDLVNFHKCHIRGEYDDSDFNIEAMRSHYGEGAFHIDYNCILVASTLALE